MSIVVDVAIETLDRPALSRARIAAIATTVLRAEHVTRAELSVTLLTRRRMATLNRRYLGHAGATDVIAFPLDGVDEVAPITGDVYICPDVAAMNAARHGVTAREELARLVVHGTLHVLGYDHPGGDARTTSPMWRRQERLLSRALRS